MLLERPPDQRGTSEINLDCSDFPAVVVGAVHVQVADRGAHRRAALRDFLRQPLGDLGGEVAAMNAIMSCRPSRSAAGRAVHAITGDTTVTFCDAATGEIIAESTGPSADPPPCKV
ncbi:MAG: hypothetical protein ACK5IN_04510 [Microbacterium sp.]